MRLTLLLVALCASLACAKASSFPQPDGSYQLITSCSNIEQGLIRLHRAGVLIVVGTDVPSPWPDAIYHFHGPQMAREMELVVEAGLTPLEAITSATRIPAEMLGLEAEIGTIEVGKRADLVLVKGDPSTDIGALPAVRWTVRDGVAHTPEGWMGW